jgi:hypothetical protein
MKAKEENDGMITDKKYHECVGPRSEVVWPADHEQMRPYQTPAFSYLFTRLNFGRLQ